MLKDVPIVLVTSTYVDEADRELGRLAGANAFVIRTPDLREMITALETVLATRIEPRRRRRCNRRNSSASARRAPWCSSSGRPRAAASARQQCAMLSAELAVLNAISEAITQDEDIDVVLRDILAACCDAGGVSIGALYLTEAERRHAHGHGGLATPARRIGSAACLDESRAIAREHHVGPGQGRDRATPPATSGRCAWLEEKRPEVRAGRAAAAQGATARRAGDDVGARRPRPRRPDWCSRRRSATRSAWR